MNMDVRDLAKRVKVRDPLVAGGVAALVVALILFGVVITALFRTMGQLRDLEAEYVASQEAITQIRTIRTSGPANMRQQVDEAQARLQTLLADFPTADQAAAELGRYYEYANALNTELVRTEAMVLKPNEGARAGYSMRRFLLEANGEVPDLLRLVARIASSTYRTFLVDNIVIRSASPAVANADLTVYAAETTLAGPSPTLGASPSAGQGGLGTSATPAGPRYTPTLPAPPPATAQPTPPATREGAVVPTVAATVAAQPTPTVGPRVHIVRSGESLIALAGRYRTSVAEIKQANNLRTSTIYVGQRLIIPGSGEGER